MYVTRIPNRDSPPAILLRESYREDGKVKTRTLANLSRLPPHVIELLRRALKGEELASVDDVFEVESSAQHGAVQAVATAMKRLGMERLLDSRPSRQRRLALALIAARILEPQSKLATSRWWHATTLPEEFDVADADEDELYAAMDWLLERQERIERKLASRHLEEGGLALYDLTSSYFEGTSCPLAALGHSRDGKKGTLQVNYGLLTDRRGCPVAVSVYPGNTSDPKTLLPAVSKLRESFGLSNVVLVGDRGMLSQKQVSELRDLEQVDWITALKTGAIRKLVDDGVLQMGLFDERNLFELTHPDFPDERLVACRNAELARLRAAKRQSLLDATVRELETVQRMVARGTLQGKDKIGLRVGRVINKYKVAKHFELEIGETSLGFHLRQERVAAEAALDGLYVIRTSVPAERLSSEDAVRSYKRLSQVERAFRSFKTLDLNVRPIHHHLENRVRAHIFLCALACYVQWHLQEAWRPLTFGDEDQQAKESRDPVAPAKRSEQAMGKVQSRTLDDGTPVHSFRTLLSELSTVVRNACRRQGAPQGEQTFSMTTTPSAKQRQAFELAASITP